MVGPADLTREQLIEIVDRIMRCDPRDDAEQVVDHVLAYKPIELGPAE